MPLLASSAYPIYLAGRSAPPVKPVHREYPLTSGPGKFRRSRYRLIVQSSISRVLLSSKRRLRNCLQAIPPSLIKLSSNFHRRLAPLDVNARYDNTIIRIETMAEGILDLFARRNQLPKLRDDIRGGRVRAAR